MSLALLLHSRAGAQNDPVSQEDNMRRLGITLTPVSCRGRVVKWKASFGRARGRPIDWISAIRELPCDIVDLDLTGTTIDDDGLAALTRLPILERLVRLDLTGTRVTSSGLAVCSQFEALRHLRIAGQRQFGGSCIGGLRLCSSLESLDLRDSSVSDADLAEIGSLEKLRGLDLSGTSITDNGLMSLLVLPRLDDLRIGKLWLTDAGVSAFLDKCLNTGIRFRRLSICSSGLTETSVARRIGAMLSLKELDIVANRFDDESLRAIALLPALESLSLSGDSYTADGLRCLGQIDTLTRLVMVHTQVTDELLDELSQLDQLRYLGLFSCRELTDKGIRSLRRFTALEGVNLGNNGHITDVVCETLSEIETLVRVRLRGTSITDRGIKLLKVLRLCELDVQFTPVSDLALGDFLEMQSLQSLGVENTQITAGGLSRLRAGLQVCTLDIPQWEPFISPLPTE